MKRSILFLLLSMLLLTACGVSPSAWSEDNNVIGILTRFEAKAEQASSTARGDLSPVIGEMIDIRTEIRVIINTTDVPEALGESITFILDGMDEIIAGAQDFSSMSGFMDMTDEEKDQHDRDASLRWSNGDYVLAEGIKTFLGIVNK